MESNARAHLIVSGRVQGVCFRAETRDAAARIGVCGWVRNQPDGTVEAVAEGPKKNVEALIDWCRQGPPWSKVTHVAVDWEDYQGAYDRFKIRF